MLKTLAVGSALTFACLLMVSCSGNNRTSETPNSQGGVSSSSPTVSSKDWDTTTTTGRRESSSTPSTSTTLLGADLVEKWSDDPQTVTLAQSWCSLIRTYNGEPPQSEWRKLLIEISGGRAGGRSDTFIGVVKKTCPTYFS
jgi:hypothetical protein